MNLKNLRDFLVLLITIGSIYVFIIPIEILHGDNIISNLVVPTIIFFCFLTYIFMFFDFMTKGRAKNNRGLWLFCFIFFNYIAAVAYYVLFYRRSLSSKI